MAIVRSPAFGPGPDSLMGLNNVTIRNVRAESGFTLIEVMIVVAIIGIIAAIAIPSYQNYVEDTRRSAAQGDLMELAQWMERRYSENFDYRADDGSNPDLPFDVSPQSHQNGNHFYEIDFDGDVQRASFTLEAEPVAGQSDDDCGTLTLDEEGEKGADQADCW